MSGPHACDFSCFARDRFCLRLRLPAAAPSTSGMPLQSWAGRIESLRLPRTRCLGAFSAANPSTRGNQLGSSRKVAATVSQHVFCRGQAQQMLTVFLRLAMTHRSQSRSVTLGQSKQINFRQGCSGFEINTFGPCLCTLNGGGSSFESHTWKLKPLSFTRSMSSMQVISFVDTLGRGLAKADGSPRTATQQRLLAADGTADSFTSAFRPQFSAQSHGSAGFQGLRSAMGRSIFSIITNRIATEEKLTLGNAHSMQHSLRSVWQLFMLQAMFDFTNLPPIQELQAVQRRKKVGTSIAAGGTLRIKKHNNLLLAPQGRTHIVMLHKNMARLLIWHNICARPFVPFQRRHEDPEETLPLRQLHHVNICAVARLPELPSGRNQRCFGGGSPPACGSQLKNLTGTSARAADGTSKVAFWNTVCKTASLQGQDVLQN